MSILEQLRNRQLIVVTGKGGVGKSAVSAALGTLLASAGRRTLVLEVDPRENVHQMLGAPPSAGEILEVAPRLHLQHLQPRAVLDHLVRERVRIEFLVHRVLGSPVYHHFTAGAPGLKEMAILGHALILVQGKVPGAPPVDVVVLDAPGTGHGVAMLEAPLLVSDVIRRGPIAALTAEVAELIASTERCGVVVVTLAEEMPVTEALELVELLRRRLEREPDLVVANSLYPPCPPPAAKAAADSGTAFWRDRRKLNERELDRLSEAWRGELKQIPLFALDRGPELTSALAARLAEA